MTKKVECPIFHEPINVDESSDLKETNQLLRDILEQLKTLTGIFSTVYNIVPQKSQDVEAQTDVVVTRKMSLLEAAIEILAEYSANDKVIKQAGMKCTEIIDALKVDGRYAFGDGKTPENSLSTAFIRETDRNGSKRIFKSKFPALWCASEDEIEKARKRIINRIKE